MFSVHYVAQTTKRIRGRILRVDMGNQVKPSSWTSFVLIWNDYSVHVFSLHFNMLCLCYSEDNRDRFLCNFRPLSSEKMFVRWPRLDKLTRKCINPIESTMFTVQFIAPIPSTWTPNNKQLDGKSCKCDHGKIHIVPQEPPKIPGHSWERLSWGEVFRREP